MARRKTVRRRKPRKSQRRDHGVSGSKRADTASPEALAAALKEYCPDPTPLIEQMAAAVGIRPQTFIRLFWQEICDRMRETYAASTSPPTSSSIH
jgi:hypothetical protein